MHTLQKMRHKHEQLWIQDSCLSSQRILFDYILCIWLYVETFLKALIGIQYNREAHMKVMFFLVSIVY